MSIKQSVTISIGAKSDAATISGSASVIAGASGSFTAATSDTGSRAGDEATLESLNGTLAGLGTGWSSDMSLSDSIDGVTVDTIGGELRVTEVDLKNKGLTGNIEIDNWENLKECTYVNFTFNSLNSQIPQGLMNLAIHKLEYLYLCYSDSGNGEINEDPHVRAQSGSGDVHPGKSKSSEDNIWTGTVPAPADPSASVLKWFILNWTDSAEEAEDGISAIEPTLFNVTSFVGLQIYNNNNVADLTFPSGLSNMTNIDQLALGIENAGRDTGFLTGSMSADFGANLSNLRHLRIDENPDLLIDFDVVDFSGMTSIHTFSVSKNKLQGTIPDYFFDGTMPELIIWGSTWPRNNTSGVEGAFPEMAAIMDMHIYQFNNNSLTSLPATAWTNCPKIIQPNFRDNELTTFGTSDLTQQDRLRYMRFGGNNLSENWPMLDWDTIAGQGGLDGVDFDRNRFVFKHMLYIPSNGTKPIIEHYQDMIDADAGNSGLDYSPQQPFGSGSDEVSGVIDFSDIVEHVDNEYQWQRNGSNISGDTAILDTGGTPGNYRLFVTNPGAPDLTLESVIITIE